MKSILLFILFIFSLPVFGEDGKSFLENKQIEIRSDLSQLNATISRIQQKIQTKSAICSKTRSSSCLQQNSVQQSQLRRAFSRRDEKQRELRFVEQKLRLISQMELRKKKTDKVLSDSKFDDKFEKEIDYEKEMELNFDQTAEQVEEKRVAVDKANNPMKYHSGEMVDNEEDEFDNPDPSLSTIVDTTEANNRSPASIAEKDKQIFDQQLVSLFDVTDALENLGLVPLRRSPRYRAAINTFSAKFDQPNLEGKVDYVETRKEYIILTKDLLIKKRGIKSARKTFASAISKIFKGYPNFKKSKKYVKRSLKKADAKTFKDLTEKEFGEFKVAIKTTEGPKNDQFFLNLKIIVKKPEIK